MRIRLIAASTVLALLSGCANMLSIHRQGDITPNGAHASGGATVTLIDAKQRAVVSSQRRGSRPDGRDTYRTVVCAEPSPDALQAVAASTAFSARAAEERLAQIAASLSEATSNIGLRTQSIQLLRDAMFRICEAYANHAMDDDEVTVLHRRYQNLMLGLLAIEQLTGAVAATQVVLHTSGAASVGAANSEVATAQQAVHAAQEEEIKARTAVQKAKDDHESSRKAEGERATELRAAKKAGDATKIGEATSAFESARSDVQEKKRALEESQRMHELRVKAVNNAQRSLVAAEGRLSTMTSASGHFNGATSRGMMDAAASQSIATAVHGIVKEVVGTSFLHEACFGYLDRMLKVDGAANAARMQYANDVMESCKGAITDIKRRLDTPLPRAEGPARTGQVTGGSPEMASTASK